MQGCPLGCAGCCNAHLLDPAGGAPARVEELLAEIDATPGLDGVTLLGGEPFAQPEPLALLARACRRRGLSVVTYTGYALSEIHALPGAGPRALLRATDLLVDGRFDATAGPSPHRNVGSANQRLLARTPRGAALVARWDEGPEVVEVRIDGPTVRVNGAPFAVRLR